VASSVFLGRLCYPGWIDSRLFLAGGKRERQREESRMALPLLQIAKLLAELTVIAPVVSDGVDKIRKLVETVRKGDSNIVKQLEALEQAVELQSAVNKKMDERLRIIESVLGKVQKSLKILAFTSVGIGIVALTALAIAILK
jgi:hypothetical protein